MVHREGSREGCREYGMQLWRIGEEGGGRLCREGCKEVGLWLWGTWVWTERGTMKLVCGYGA